jgi:hypothetical protein
MPPPQSGAAVAIETATTASKRASRTCLQNAQKMPYPVQTLDEFGWSAKKNGSSPNNYRKFMALISLTQSQPPGLMDGLPAWILILAEMAAEAYLGKTAN